MVCVICSRTFQLGLRSVDGRGRRSGVGHHDSRRRRRDRGHDQGTPRDPHSTRRAGSECERNERMHEEGRIVVLEKEGKQENM